MDAPSTEYFAEVLAAADWWANQLASDLPKQDNGDAFQSGLASVLGARMPRPMIEQVDSFRKLLAEKLQEECNRNWHPEEPIRGGAFRTVAVDYHPDQTLCACCELAGIAVHFALFPMKTCMWIDPGSVKVRCGYGAECETVWSSERKEQKC